MTTGQRSALVLAAILLAPTLAGAQRQVDVDAVNALIDQYGALEDAMDMTAQAQLMAADRVWVVQGGGRRTDQATNMRIQQATVDALKKRLPGVQRFTEDRDRLVRFYASGSVAIATFYRYTTLILPSTTPLEVAQTVPPPPPAVVTLVLEKRDGQWRIVHTHISNLAVAN